MARTTVKIEVPNGSPDELLNLLKALLAEHAHRVKDAPATVELPPTLVAKLKTALDKADPKRQEVQRLSAQLQALNQELYTDLGIATGQTTRTPDTVLNLLTAARDTLQGLHLGSEQALETYGFDVVIGTAASPKAKPKAAKPA